MAITYKDDMVVMHTFQINLKDGTRQFRRLQAEEGVYEHYKACDIQSIVDLGATKTIYRSI